VFNTLDEGRGQLLIAYFVAQSDLLFVTLPLLSFNICVARCHLHLFYTSWTSRF
jgi:hypothetical protein